MDGNLLNLSHSLLGTLSPPVVRPKHRSHLPRPSPQLRARSCNRGLQPPGRGPHRSRSTPNPLIRRGLGRPCGCRSALAVRVPQAMPVAVFFLPCLSEVLLPSLLNPPFFLPSACLLLCLCLPHVDHVVRIRLSICVVALPVSTLNAPLRPLPPPRCVLCSTQITHPGSPPHSWGADRSA